ncbi:hypothetical protein [Sulfitobacter noctilucicola]|nr:hypothetical protein [Sulfitobacter noctilucicola]
MQDVSNAGEPISNFARQAVDSAICEGLVDEVVHYQPSFDVSRKDNETKKRQIGLNVARLAGATHFVSLDADEFYRTDEALGARKQIAAHGWKSTSVNSFLHVRRPVWRTLDTTCCCFITEIQEDTVMGYKPFAHPNVDPSRGMTCSPAFHHHFDIQTVAMYHMNLIRRDFDQKLRNSSTMDQGFLAKVAKAVSAWDPGQKLEFPNKGALSFELVENEFETFDPQ